MCPRSEPDEREDGGPDREHRAAVSPNTRVVDAGFEHAQMQLRGESRTHDRAEVARGPDLDGNDDEQRGVSEEHILVDFEDAPGDHPQDREPGRRRDRRPDRPLVDPVAADFSVALGDIVRQPVQIPGTRSMPVHVVSLPSTVPANSPASKLTTSTGNASR